MHFYIYFFLLSITHNDLFVGFLYNHKFKFKKKKTINLINAFLELQFYFPLFSFKCKNRKNCSILINPFFHSFTFIFILTWI